jgi:hypothetical protein
MCKLRNPRLQYNSPKIHFRHGHHFGNHEQQQHCRKKAKERSIKKPHPNCEEATGLGVRGGSVQKHKSECSC